MRKWKYTDNEREPSTYPFCWDCGILYPFPVEMCVPIETWEQINPTEHKGCGLLCHNCMIERLREIGVTFVEVTTFIVIPEDEIGIPVFGDED